MNWEYSLTPQEEATCVEVGYQRQKPYFGDPTRNINYSEGDLWEMWQHIVCAGSELAFARMMGNKDFIPHYNKWKSELDLPEWGEVRYSFGNLGLRFTNRDNPELKYVLLVGGLANKPTKQKPTEYKSSPYIALGWMYGVNCMEDEYKFNDKSWYVPADNLRSMEYVYA
jgi:hypothetical protein